MVFAFGSNRTKALTSGGRKYPTPDNLIIKVLQLFRDDKIKHVTFYTGLATWQKPVYIEKTLNYYVVKFKKKFMREEIFQDLLPPQTVVENGWRLVTFWLLRKEIYNSEMLRTIIQTIYGSCYNCKADYKLKVLVY